MDMKMLRAELQRLAVLAEGWDAAHGIPDIERDLALEKLRTLYDALRFGLERPEGEAASSSDEPSAQAEAVAAVAVATAVSEMVADVSAEFSGETMQGDGNAAVATALDRDDAADEEPPVVAGDAAAEPEVADEDNGTDAGDSPAAEYADESGADAATCAGAGEQSESGSDHAVGGETVEEALPETADAAAPVGAEDPEPAALELPEVGELPDVTDLSEMAGDAGLDGPSGEDSDPEEGGTAVEFEEITIETFPELEPFADADIHSDERMSGGGESLSEMAADPAVTEGEESQCGAETESDADGTFEIADAPDAAGGEGEIEIAASVSEEMESVFDWGELPDPIPATEFGGTPSPEAGVADPSDAFGEAWDPMEVKRTRHRMVLSLYGTDGADAVGSSSGGDEVDRQPEVAAGSAGTPDETSPRGGEAGDCSSSSPNKAEGRSATGISEPPTTMNMERGGSGERVADRLAGQSEGMPVLGEMLNANVRTVSDLIADTTASSHAVGQGEPVTDLRHALCNNDRFLLARDLFGGDMELCERTIDRLNRFDDLDECMIYIAEHFRWNPNSDGAKLLVDLLERKLV